MTAIRNNLCSLALLFFLAVPTASCATILGTAVSPITGGVDLAMQKYDGKAYMQPVWFIAGMVAGPFQAFYNGVNYDASIFQSFSRYWTGFDAIFRPFRL